MNTGNFNCYFLLRFNTNLTNIVTYLKFEQFNKENGIKCWSVFYLHRWHLQKLFAFSFKEGLGKSINLVVSNGCAF